MRTIVAFTGLAVVGLLCGTGAALSKDQSAPKGLPSTVDGYGDTVEKAKKAALDNATSEIKKLMKRCDPPIEAFVATPDELRAFVEEHVVDKGKPGPDEKFPNDITKRDHVFKAWVYTFRSDNDWWSEVLRRNSEMERSARAKGRESLAMRIVLGVTLVLAAAFGYVQLDDYTQRQYTIMLRLAAGAVTAVVLAGWYLMAF